MSKKPFFKKKQVQRIIKGLNILPADRWRLPIVMCDVIAHNNARGDRKWTTKNIADVLLGDDPRCKKNKEHFLNLLDSKTDPIEDFFPLPNK